MATGSAKNSATASASVSFPFFGLLGIVFVILKLNPGGLLTSPVVDWSWWWVTAPFWGPWALLVAFLIVLSLGWLVVTLIDDFISKRARKARDKARQELRKNR